MKAITYRPSHPIVFIFDFANKEIEVPEYDPNSVVSANDSCISVRTIADVDGEVTIELIDNSADIKDLNPIEVFNGTINFPGHKINVVNSHYEKLLEAEIFKTRAKIQVLVDDKEYPSKIWIKQETNHDSAT